MQDKFKFELGNTEKKGYVRRVELDMDGNKVLANREAAHHATGVRVQGANKSLTWNNLIRVRLH